MHPSSTYLSPYLAPQTGPRGETMARTLVLYKSGGWCNAWDVALLILAPATCTACALIKQCTHLTLELTDPMVACVSIENSRAPTKVFIFATHASSSYITQSRAEPRTGPCHRGARLGPTHSSRRGHQPRQLVAKGTGTMATHDHTAHGHHRSVVPGPVVPPPP